MNVPESVIDFLIIIGIYYWERVKDAAVRIGAGVNPWNVKTFVSGMAGMAYLLGGVALLVIIFINGFGRHYKLNCAALAALGVLFVLSALK